ncbi:MAG: metallophosphoesterase [Gemmatimonadales bacterium]
MSDAVVAHISDIHFGGRADPPLLAALATFLPSLAPRAIVVSGDISQRARHGEFQAARWYFDRLAATAPVHVIPGNHDVQWWRSPWSLLGSDTKYVKYRTYFGENLAPVLELDGLVIAGMLSAHGVTPGSTTWNINDTAVKGHLPAAEVARVRALFQRLPAETVRLATLHHNVIPGPISHRWGLARPRAAQRALLTLDADVVLCGHDHTEAAGQIDGKLAVSTAGTLSLRSRGGRPSTFNLVKVTATDVSIQHYVYDRPGATFRPGDTTIYARARRAV